MTIETPIWMQGTGGVPAYSARQDRTIIEQLWDEGVIDLTAFKVTQRAAGANYTVDVSTGAAVVAGDDQVNQGAYLVRCTATENVTITAAPGSNSRYDLVCLRINDPNAGGNAGYTASIVVTAGTVSATPVVPATPPSSLPLAVVGPISSGTASITTGVIADARVEAGRRCRPGTMELSAITRAPSGWLLCDGSAVSRTTYARLFAAIGSTFGPGNGSTTFNLPDLRDRVPVAQGTTFATAGATGGEVNHTILSTELPSHTHTVPAHSHTGLTGTENQTHIHGVSFTSGNRDTNHTHQMAALVADAFGGIQLGFGSDYGRWSANYSNTTIENTGHTHPINGTTQTENAQHTHNITPEPATATTATGGGGAANNMQPYQVCGGWLIRT